MKAGKFLRSIINRITMLAMLLVPTFLVAQVYIEILPSTPLDGAVNIYGRGTLSQKIPYENITGSPFWKDEYKPATLYGRDAKEKWERMAKINLVTNEIYFKEPNGTEQIVSNGVVQKIFFHALNDPENIEARFLNGVQMPYGSADKITGFLQILNVGRYQLLKNNLRKTMEADSMFGTLKRYFFKDDIKYFLADNNKLFPVKKLYNDAFISLGQGETNNNNWLNQTKTDLRKEGGVISFLGYLNVVE